MKYMIKEYREELGLTQEELSKKANVSRQIIYRLENDMETVTSTKTLEKIANALNKKVSEIFLA